MLSTGVPLLERIIEAKGGAFSEEHAQYILTLDFSPEQHARYRGLAEKAQAGTLSEEEAAEIDEFLAANSLLTVLQSKARLSLQRRQPAA